ncbi:MAG TPA: amino acid adenylation domain-containing protein [Nostocaceae cyanobacterium]|nr:amino acid adenylation domain-containing protein [Nostocaceae cyanobacterium]
MNISGLSAEQQELLMYLLEEEEIQITPQQPLPSLVPDLAGRYQPFPLTDIQQAYFIGRNGAFEISNVACQGYTESESENLDLERYNLAWQKLIDRHDMLRAIIHPDGQQQILPQVPPYQISVVDLRRQSKEEINTQLAAIRERMSHQVLPTDQWPLFEICASLLDENRIRIHINFDALIGDQWSLQIIFRELAIFYQNPDAVLPDLEISFRDYVLTEASGQNLEVYERSQQYWLDRLPTLPPAPELPLAKNPATLTRPHFQRRLATLDPQTWTTIKNRATKAGLTASGVLLGAFASILQVWSKNPQFTLNLTLFNRLPLHPQVNDLVGDFTSLTLLAVESSGNESFEVRARQLQQQLWQDLEHRHFSGVRVLRELARGQSGNNRTIMPVVFTSTLTLDNNSENHNIAFDQFGEIIYSVTQTPQVWIDHQIFEQQGCLVFNWDVVEELFPPGLIDDMFTAYCSFLQRLADDQQVWQENIWQLVPEKQLAQRQEVNATSAPVPAGLLHTWFAQQVKERSSQQAVVSKNLTLTYAELFQLSQQIGDKLRKIGACPNQLVAIVMDKGWEQILAALAILTAGAAYLPIDATLPQERQRYLLEQGEVKIVLTQSKWKSTLELPEGILQLCIDTEVENLGDEDVQPLPPVQQPSDLAYVIYTSGSTGKPKGVMIDHRAALNTIIDINHRFNLQPQDRLLALSSLSFDLSVYDIFGTLAAGGTIIIPEPHATKDPAHWWELISQEQVTVWNSVPALMQMLVEYLTGHGKKLPDSLRLVLLSGDWIPLNLPEQIKNLGKNIQVIGLGGATEAAIWSNFYQIKEIDPNWKSIPYGKPLSNQRFYVLNHTCKDVPVWVPGQLYIGGLGLAQGYWKDTEKTQTSFIIHPYTGERLYKTGDLGRYLPDGNLEFLGREDFQVKVSGYRIELGEVEAALIQHPAVDKAVVTAIEQKLIAYVVLDQDQATDVLKMESSTTNVNQLWAKLVNTGNQQALEMPSEVNLETYQAFWQGVERLSTLSMCHALNKLGVFISPQEKYSVDDLVSRCQIAPRYRKLLGQWLQVLESEGLLYRDGAETFVNSQPLPTDSLDELWRQIVEFGSWGTQGKTLLHYLENSVKNNTALLTGELDPLELFFPGGSWQTAESLYQFNPVQDYYNQIASKVLQVIAESFSLDKTLQILEVGAGTGGTTASLLPVLPKDRTVYTYTDISNFFTNQAQEKFRDYSFVKYGLLNIDENPINQGYEPYSFDVVVAVNVLHDARNISKTLDYVRSLLAPHGLILILEGTQNSRLQMISVGFIEGFSHFEDERLHTNLPLLSVEQWETTLKQSGFEEFVAFPGSDCVTAQFGQRVIVARSPATVKRFQPNELRYYLRNKLPEYMIPSSYVLLDSLPLTPNGKIDRRALPQPYQVTSEKTSYIAPRTQIEQQLASLWMEVLGVQKVGIYDNFFDLGGDSLFAIKLISQANKVGINLKTEQIFQHPILANLAQQLEQGKPDEKIQELTPNSALLIPIQPQGEKPPFFCIAPSNGNVDCYFSLASQLGLEQPVYGLQMQNLQQQTSLEMMAAAYLSSLRTIQPQGPYFLGGLSMGGVVALEMAQQLYQQGENVALLALLDIGVGESSDLPSNANDAVYMASMLASDDHLFLSEDIQQRIEKLQEIAEDDENILESLITEAKKNKLVNADFTLKEARHYINIVRTNIRILRNYTPLVYPGQITLFRAQERPRESLTNPSLGWDKLATKGVEFYTVPGSHFSMLRQPHVQVLAKQLKLCLEKKT